jgi:hypothetical protein
MKPFYDKDGIVIYNANCLDVLPTLESVDHVITDPPYARDVYVRLGMPKTKKGSGTPGRLHGSAVNHQYSSMSIEKLAAGDIGAIDEMILPCAFEFGRLAARWSIVFSDVETTHRWRFALEEAGMRYVRTGAWVKPDYMPQFSGDRPAVGFEPCTITHAQGPMRWNGGGHSAVWTHGTAKGDARPDHPCPKPLALMIELVSLFTDRGDLVLDPFGGSMTTAVACKRLGRRCISIELDKKWCADGAKRVDATSPEIDFDAYPREEYTAPRLIEVPS